ncbi:MAG TPA: phosphoadenosine phosphosulfate reductase, partial [Pseudomonas sp.]|nr:phosphoadenosine phosphosulfate reductase [Pseudomonas sp.]
MSPSFDVVELATTYANKSAQDILKLAFAEFGD